MKLYAVADLHGRKDRIDAVCDMARQTTPDLIICAGDLMGFEKTDYPLLSLSRLNLPVYFIRGNSDGGKTGSILKRFPNITPLHLSVTYKNNMKITGVDGTFILPFHSRLALNEKKIHEALLNFIQKDMLFVGHPPPMGVLDMVLGKIHSGSRCIRDIIEQKQPRIYICGHIHDTPGIEMLANTLVVNCSMGKKGKGALIEIPDNGKAVASLLN